MMFPKRSHFVVRGGRATRDAHIAPEFIARAVEHLRDTGEPLLEAPQGAEAFLFARSDLDYELYLGDPYAEPPKDHLEGVRGGSPRDGREPIQRRGPGR